MKTHLNKFDFTLRPDYLSSFSTKIGPNKKCLSTLEKLFVFIENPNKHLISQQRSYKKKHSEFSWEQCFNKIYVSFLKIAFSI